MTSKKLSSIVFAMLMVGTVLTTVAEAQRAPIQRTGRWLGIGYGDGYHRCDPLSDPGYYNPYSAHNSLLISKSPLYANSAIQSTDLLSYGRFHQGIPFSVYAAPAGSNVSSYGHNFQSIPGQAVDNSFEPYEGDEEDEDDEEEKDDKDTASMFNPDIISSPLPTSPSQKQRVISSQAGFKDTNSFQPSGELEPGAISLKSDAVLELIETEPTTLDDPFK